MNHSISWLVVFINKAVLCHCIRWTLISIEVFMWCPDVIKRYAKVFIQKRKFFSLVAVYVAILVHNSQNFSHCSSWNFNHWYHHHCRHFLADLGYFPSPTLHHLWLLHHFLPLVHQQSSVEYYFYPFPAHHHRFSLLRNTTYTRFLLIIITAIW